MAAQDAEPGETYFAPARRANRESLEASRHAFLSNHVAVKLLEAIPNPAMVLNAERQLVAANARLRALLKVDSLDAVFGLRLGEALHCVNCPHTEAGCGTGPYCVQCGAVQAMLESFEGHTTVSRECRLRSMHEEEEQAFDLEVQATFVEITGADLLVVALRDIERGEEAGGARASVLSRCAQHRGRAERAGPVPEHGSTPCGIGRVKLPAGLAPRLRANARGDRRAAAVAGGGAGGPTGLLEYRRAEAAAGERRRALRRERPVSPRR